MMPFSNTEKTWLWLETVPGGSTASPATYPRRRTPVARGKCAGHLGNSLLFYLSNLIQSNPMYESIYIWQLMPAYSVWTRTSRRSTIDLSIYLSIYLCICLSISISIYQSIYLSISIYYIIFIYHTKNGTTTRTSQTRNSPSAPVTCLARWKYPPRRSPNDRPGVTRTSVLVGSGWNPSRVGTTIHQLSTGDPH